MPDPAASFTLPDLIIVPSGAGTFLRHSLNLSQMPRFLLSLQYDTLPPRIGVGLYVWIDVFRLISTVTFV